MDAKFITVNVNDQEMMFTFPACIDHNSMFEPIEMIGITEDYHVFEGELVSAGFITPSGNCYGESETLSIGSRPEDTELYASNQLKNVVYVEPVVPKVESSNSRSFTHRDSGKKKGSYSKNLAARFSSPKKPVKRTAL